MNGDVAWAAGGALIGAIIGSFLATMVLRWPEGRTLLGRSSCDGCSRQLHWFELVPLVSFVVQRGRCRRCAAPIAAQHFVIELVCAGVGAAALGLYPGADGAMGALFGWLLVALAALDLKHFWLPDELTAAVALLGVGGGIAMLPPAEIDRLIGGIVGFALLWGIGSAYKALRGRDGMGAGDPKLFGAIGLWVGWQALPLVLLGASAVGLGMALTLMLRGKTVRSDTRLPFGTLMAVAAFPVWLFAV